MNQASDLTLPLLRGLNVVESVSETGGRYCGRLFARLGARVTRVGASPETPFDRWLDQGKLIADGLEAALAPAMNGGRPADIVILGQDKASVQHAHDALDALGVDPVRLNLTWFGREGPYSDWRGDDAAVLALSGLAYGFGPVDGPPVLAQGPGLQVLAGATLFAAGLAALRGREAGQDRRSVDVSVLEAALCFSEHSPPAHAGGGAASARRGLNRYGLYPATAYRSQDGWIGVTAHTPAQWRALCELLERPDLASDPRFLTGATRAAHAAEVDEALCALFSARTSGQWLEAGQAARIPLAPVPTPAQILATDHWLQRESFGPVPGSDRVIAPDLPFRADPDGYPAPLLSPAPEGRPLSGVKVIDFTMGWAGPLATRHLADLGADIVKIESETHFDWSRGFAPIPGSDPPAHEIASAYNVMNRNKRCVSLDLTTPVGVAAARALVADADIVIENYAPGVMERFGLGAATLRQLRPGLIFVAMGAFGDFGPWRGFRAYGSTVEQASGLCFVNGQADWPPVLQHVAFGDPVAGVFGAAVVLAALAGRGQVGGGFYDLSQVECLFQLGAQAIIESQEPEGWRRTGSRSRGRAPRCVVRAAGEDAWIAICCQDEAAWRALARLIGRPDWARETALGSPEARNARGDQIEKAIADWGRALDPLDAIMQLQAAGIAAAPVLAPHTLGGDPHLMSTGAWSWMDRLHVGRHMMQSPPYHIDGARPEIMTPAPLLGEHTEHILAKLRP